MSGVSLFGWWAKGTSRLLLPDLHVHLQSRTTHKASGMNAVHPLPPGYARMH
jgi:hypothetical protein